MIYDLWDSESGNIIGTFATRGDALSVVRQALAEHGAEYVATLLLGQEDKRGQTKAIAHGKKLVELALTEKLAPST